MPDVLKAKVAARRIYTLLHLPVPIQSLPKDGLDVAHGRIEFLDVTFSYPTRPEAQVLKGLSFTVESGKTLALVGASGCGKSTVVALLERFYEPTGGSILVDGMPIQGVMGWWDGPFIQSIPFPRPLYIYIFSVPLWSCLIPSRHHFLPIFILFVLADYELNRFRRHLAVVTQVCTVYLCIVCLNCRNLAWNYN